MVIQPLFEHLQFQRICCIFRTIEFWTVPNIRKIFLILCQNLLTLITPLTPLFYLSELQSNRDYDKSLFEMATVQTHQSSYITYCLSCSLSMLSHQMSFLGLNMEFLLSFLPHSLLAVTQLFRSQINYYFSLRKAKHRKIRPTNY